MCTTCPVCFPHPVPASLLKVSGLSRRGQSRNRNRKGPGSPWLRALVLGVLTFVIALTATYPAQQIINRLSVIFGVITIGVILLIGILFDILGVATAAADEAPFHAMAARRLPGSRQAIWLVRHAAAVSSFSNDVVGDAAGTVSGAAAAAIALRLPALWPGWDPLTAGMLMVALVSGLTVGGKALGKAAALRSAQGIVLAAGRALYVVERLGLFKFTVGRSGRNDQGAGSRGNKAAGRGSRQGGRWGRRGTHPGPSQRARRFKKVEPHGKTGPGDGDPGNNP